MTRLLRILKGERAGPPTPRKVYAFLDAGRSFFRVLFRGAPYVRTLELHEGGKKGDTEDRRHS